ncbi:MAG TPA: helix-turn-helix transcriptional regulator, partial [Gemmatimonadales bacterium]|nr:helix-turn-helix transcriptional regulator [Gemmatimonadales bacterium]
LAVAMVAFAAFILEGVYYDRGFMIQYPQFIGVSVPLVYLFGPILYLYTEVVSHGGHTFQRRWLLHFIPVTLVTLWLMPFYLQSGAEKLAFLHRMDAVGPPRDVAIISLLQYPHGFLYVALTFGVLRKHGARLRANYSAIEHINLTWLRNLLIGTAAVWGVATALELIQAAGIPMTAWEHRLTPLALSVLVYAIGYMGLLQPEIFRHAVPGEVTPTTPGAPTAPAEESTGYGKSGLTEAEAAARLQQLRALMDEKHPYRRSQLTLQELADEMGMSTHNLSQVINTQAGKSFYDFINGYRAEEAMRRLRDPKSAHLTILAIAEESGFNSKATFNAFFKRHAGVTPSQYRANPS